MFTFLSNLLKRKDVRRGQTRSLSRKLQSSPHLEELGSRILPATLNINLAGQAVYTGGITAGDNLTLSEAAVSGSLVARTFTDTVDTINVSVPVVMSHSITGNGTHTVTWSGQFGFGSIAVNMQAATDAVNVQSIDLPTSVEDDGGADTVTVGTLSPTLGGTLAGILAPLSVGNKVYATALTVDDSRDIGHIISLGYDSVQANIGQKISFLAGVKSVDIYGGDSAVFDMPASGLFGKVTMHGGFGYNTVFSGGMTNLWNITGTNAGTLQIGTFQSVAFQNIQNLQDYKAGTRDTFVFSNGASLTGMIEVNSTSIGTLDYSNYLTPVIVDLRLHVATGVTGGVYGVRDVFGGQGNNILVGDGNDNYLRGGSGRDILISGGGSSTLQAGSGEAILISARYTGSTSRTALDALMAEWSATYDAINAQNDFNIRANHLRWGGGLNGSTVLNGSTLVGQSYVTRLITGTGPDFYFFDPLDVLVNPPRAEDMAVAM
jgi:hypothetical protein